MVALALSLVVAALGIASYLTTAHRWLGALPLGECKIKVVNEMAEPLEGCELNVYRQGSRENVTEEHFDEARSGRKLVSDSMGRISCHAIKGGKFGGLSWRLLWVFPMGASRPEYDCRISCNSYETATFSIWELFEHVVADTRIRYEVRGNVLELPVFTYEVVTRRKRRR